MPRPWRNLAGAAISASPRIDGLDQGIIEALQVSLDSWTRTSLPFNPACKCRRLLEVRQKLALRSER
jgi:hypothetical protein